MRSVLIATLLGVANVTAPANAAEIEPPVPLTIASISSFRVGENLVRVILHNMERKPQVEVELIEVPGMERPVWSACWIGW